MYTTVQWAAAVLVTWTTKGNRSPTEGRLKAFSSQSRLWLCNTLGTTCKWSCSGPRSLCQLFVYPPPSRCFFHVCLYSSSSTLSWEKMCISWGNRWTLSKVTFYGSTNFAISRTFITFFCGKIVDSTFMGGKNGTIVFEFPGMVERTGWPTEII